MEGKEEAGLPCSLGHVAESQCCRQVMIMIWPWLARRWMRRWDPSILKFGTAFALYEENCSKSGTWRATEVAKGGPPTCVY
ncbi:hypothetical protein V6N12_040031 [Hibiscus sabdariffa]|uniref:Uncharacterized protein n=1 Tax=Hibiscus sabdariffa TaxID=183260 RepID=A0ABR2E2G9_9ROSI